MAEQIRGLKLFTLVIAREQRGKVLELERGLNRQVKVVDDFYDCLGPRNWIFHDKMDLSKIEAILGETRTAESAEARLIDLYRDKESTRFWIMGLRGHAGLRARIHHIERARDLYFEDRFDSCVLHLIAVMDGFVNDFEPDVRKGLAARVPEDMAAWDSVVGHHLGLTHVMKTFGRTFKKRVDEEVFEIYRHGIVHGSVVNFNNVVVATKAWNMLFAVADWARATERAAKPPKPQPTWNETWAVLKRRAARKKHEKEFVPATIFATDPGFTDDEIVLRASEFLDAWSHGRWGIVARFTPPMLLWKSDNESARFAKEVFGSYKMTSWDLTSVDRHMPGAAEIRAMVTVNEATTEMKFWMVFGTVDGNVALPGDDGATWRLAVWAPRTFFTEAA
jgi:hypothetical protein